ncbi:MULTISPECIES: alpha-2,3-sialyltransferase [unclassified Helicobacter]|uniref:alpha-2,3-sialyltransferase n=1 Tax=unclassified Helicobacter TaxID=2593540 RepID=UPI000CF1A5D3|nr:MULTISPECIES: alpha-2,3-sialyltransferase [unclassified Helicobacter]
MKPIIVAGNGPSLAKIDYARLPRDFDVFRCNQFYFEDKYFLGKKIKGAFFNPGLFFEQYFTLKNLVLSGEYEIEKFYCSLMLWPTEGRILSDDFQFFYPDVTLVYKLFKEFQELHTFLKFNDLYYHKRITSGVLMVLVAAIIGYRDIFITGIDFYESQNYVFINNQPNICSLVPSFSSGDVKTQNHTKDIDLQTLDFARKYFNLKLYSISPESPLDHLLEKKYFNIEFELLEKEEGYTKDIMIPEKKKPVHIFANKVEALSYKLEKIDNRLANVEERIYINFYIILYRDFKNFLKLLLKKIKL